MAIGSLACLALGLDSSWGTGRARGAHQTGVAAQPDGSYRRLGVAPVAPGVRGRRIATVWSLRGAWGSSDMAGDGGTPGSALGGGR
jgi:hypothetical protein